MILWETVENDINLTDEMKPVNIMLTKNFETEYEVNEIVETGIESIAEAFKKCKELNDSRKEKEDWYFVVSKDHRLLKR